MDAYIEVAEHMLAAARPIALEYFRAPLTVERKTDFSPVTRADRQIETAMKGVLRQYCPDHGILGEEHGATELNARFVWVIDPIDGTKSFISGVPLFGTLIALLDRGRPVMGVIDMPVLGETWVGSRSHVTRYGQAPCHTNTTQSLQEAILFTTSPDVFSAEALPVLDALGNACIERRFGGDCYSYGLLASGHIDLILETGLQPYDYLPLVSIVNGAGGVITDWEGKALGLHSDGRVLAAATLELHREALALITSFGQGRG